jgi:hypothetical protein
VGEKGGDCLSDSAPHLKHRPPDRDARASVTSVASRSSESNRPFITSIVSSLPVGASPQGASVLGPFLLARVVLRETRHRLALEVIADGCPGLLRQPEARSASNPMRSSAEQDHEDDDHHDDYDAAPLAGSHGLSLAADP